MQNKTRIMSIILMILFTIFTASAQMLIKLGVKDNILFFQIISGIIIYGIGTILFLIALKHGELSILYPIISLGIVWVTLISIIYFKEQIDLPKSIGMLCIILGISILGVRR